MLRVFMQRVSAGNKVSQPPERAMWNGKFSRFRVFSAEIYTDSDDKGELQRQREKTRKVRAGKARKRLRNESKASASSPSS